MIRERILQVLCSAQGDFISGGKLADNMGISRVAVWKHIEALKKEGYNIVGLSGRGYILKDANCTICPADLPHSIPTNFVGRDIRHFTVVDSTNKVARRLLEAGEIGSGGLVIADRQSHGKGRRGRKWESPLGGLWFSLILQPQMPLAEIPLLSLVFALAVARGLDEYLPFPSQIKWPNDIYFEDRKIVGILLELSGELDHPDYVIAGIGINVNIHVINLPEEISNTAISLLQAGQRSYRMLDVLQTILLSLDTYYQRLLNEGFTNILTEYKSRCRHLGKIIRVNLGNRVLEGINIDIDAQGSLLLDTGGSMERLSTGDVALIEPQEE